MGTVKPKPTIIIYSSHLNKIGGVETFVLNFCKRLNLHYNITLVYNTTDNEMLQRISKYVDCQQLSKEILTADVLVLATAWGRTPEGMITAPVQVQMVHADYVACIEGWNFTYKKLSTTTHHIAVSNHVSKQFEKATHYKIDKVIYNLL